MTAKAASNDRRLVIALLLAGSLRVALADVDTDSVVSLRSDIWSGDRQLGGRSGVGAASLWGRSRIDAGEAGQVVATGWLRAQAPHDSEPNGRLRELYWRKTLGPIDVKLGRQMVVWGRADGLNPTDNLSPRDFRLLAPRDGDLRHGNESINVSIDVPIGSASLLWFPHAATHTIPLEVVAGVGYFVEKPRASQWAARWEFSGLGEQSLGVGIDGSVSYFDGRDPMPDLTFGSLSATGLQVVLRNQRLKVLGADLSFVRNGIVWRAEIASTRTASHGPADFSHKKPQVWVVGGGEWTFSGATTLGVQATMVHVDAFGDPDRLAGAGPLRDLAWRQLATSGQSARDQAGVLWRLARRLDHDNVTIETSGVALWSSRGGAVSGLLRASADIAIDDRWQVQVGGERYFGPIETQFGQLRANSLVYAQLRRGF